MNAQVPPLIEMPVFDGSGPQSFADAVSDRIGGHFITYGAYGSTRSEVIAYLHRIGGRSPWSTPIRINEYAGGGAKLALTNDGIGVAWVEYRSDTGLNFLRFQKYSFAGAPLWTPSPTAGAEGFQVRGEELVWLSNGISLFAVTSGYTGPAKGEGYVVYRVSADGTVTETWLSRILRGVPGNFRPAACVNRAREVILVFPGEQVTAHKLSPTGEPLWGSAAVRVTSDFSVKSSVAVACDDAGGASIVWSDNRRTPATLDLYAQHLNTDGRATWSSGGIELARNGGVVGNIDIAPDESGGAYIAAIKQVYPEGITTLTVPRVYGFHVSADGRLDIGAGGGLRLDPIVGTAREVEVVSDGIGGALVSWQAFDSSGRIVDGVPRPASSRDINCIAHVWLKRDGRLSWGPEPARVGQCGANAYARKLVVSNGSVSSFWSDIRAEYTDVYRWTFDAPGVAGLRVLTAPARLDRIITPRPPSTPRTRSKLPAGVTPRPIIGKP